ncbi:putative bifunctional diguanylate cyclase/phosphodiesterase [Arenibacterium sp. LLYu02]|uniref:putative bifunctional diguanylate cyclase/phosphodiesterase n=1 Tax=Arenibacterium sp. LLYu02 TaxID=3404132 RepID=UPI003B217B88
MLSAAKQWRRGKARHAAAAHGVLPLACLLIPLAQAAFAARMAPSPLQETDHFLLDAQPPLGWTVLYVLCFLAFASLACAEVVRRLRKGSQAPAPLARSVVEGGPMPLDSLATLDDQGRLLRANPRFLAESDLSAEQIEGHPIWTLYQKGFGQTYWQGVLAEARKSGVWSGEVRTLGESNVPEVESLTVTAKPGGLFEFHARRQKPDLRRASTEARLRDVLTTLPSRRAMRIQVEQAIKRGQASGGELALMVLDLDRFRDINAVFGDDIGDRVLERLAEALMSVARPGVTVGRIGGDEFILMVEGQATSAALMAVAEDIFTALGEEIVIDGLTCRLSASIGIAQFPKDGQTHRDLMQAAGVSLCHAKAKGRGQVSFYADNMEQRSEDSLQMEADLRRAIARGEFLMHYQPQIDLRTGQCIGAEALLRWQHPKKGLLLPGGFVPLALDSGLTTAIDRFVVQEVCRQIGLWRGQGYVPGRIAINMSAVTLLTPDFAQDLGTAARAHNVDPAELEIEVLESTMFPRISAAFNTVYDLRTLGVNLAIDDFGTGYSSLAMLKDLPVDRIKLDRRFITGLPGDAKDDRIIAAMVALGRSLGITVIAEGVETTAQRDRLIELGCPEAQGFLFSRPVPAEAFASRWLKTNRQSSRVGAAN